jgi:choline dehydrogenase-like flavoprotein
LVERLGGRVLSGGDPDPAKAVSVGGQIIHEAGTARMGRDPASSVVDPFGQAWEVPNLFLSDAAVFASAPHKNPTLTVLALAWRNAEHVAQRLGSGSL